MRIRLASTALAVALTSTFATVPGARSAQLEFRTTTKISVEPAPKPHGGYLAKVEIADAASGEVLFAPTVSFRKGTPARMSARDKSGETLAFEITVSEAGDQARYALDRVHEGETRRIEEVTISLAGATVQPAADLAVLTKVTIEPTQQPRGAYLATIEVSHAVTGEVLSTPSVAFRRGDAEGAMTRSGLRDGSEIVVNLKVSDAGDQATYSVDRVRDQQSVRVQEATITLAR
jgi:hypothetical protein